MNGIFLNALKSPHQIFQGEGILFYPQIFEGEELARLRAACEFVLEQFLEDLDANHPEAGYNANSMRHLNDSRWHKENKEHWKTIMEAIADPRCLGPVEQIFRGQSLFYTTSLFFNPRFESQEGNWHRDHQFILENEEEVKKYLDGVSKGEDGAMDGVQFQIALVDNEDVEYVPFSPGRYDSPQEYYYRCADERTHCTEEGMPNAMRIRQRAGDAIIFNSAGLHRGRYHVDKPRRTFMLTYTKRHKLHYSEFSYQPWMLEPNYLAGLSPRARVYFEDFIRAYEEFWKGK